MLIGISGLKGSGKTTVARYLRDEHGFDMFNFADPLKRAAQEVFLLSEAQCYDQELKEQVDPRWDKTPRKILQLFGTEVGRAIDKDTWIKRTMFDAEPSENAVIGDCRFQNEADAIRAHGGIVLGIDRRGIVPDNHPSEMEMFTNWSDIVDITISNSGTLEDLLRTVEATLEMVL